MKAPQSPNLNQMKENLMQGCTNNPLTLALVTLYLLQLTTTAQSTTQIAHWDFKRGLQGWTGNSMITNLRVTPEGLTMETKAPDPFLTSPVIDCPEGQHLLITIKMRSNADIGGQIYFGTTFQEQDSRQFVVQSDAKWHEYKIPLAPQNRGIRLRLDPCHITGNISLAWVRVESSPEPPQERWGSPKELRGKKAIVAGQFATNGGESAVTSRFLAKHPDFPATLPYDGYVIPAVIDAEWSQKMGLPVRDYFLHELQWNNVKIPYEALVSVVKDLRSVHWHGVTDNFLNFTLMDGAKGRFTPDLANDQDWENIQNNAALAARLCREAHLKGFWLDTEQYGAYRWRTATGTPEYDSTKPQGIPFPLGKDTPELLRKRGTQWIKAVQREFPAVKIIVTFAWSPDANSYGPLKGTTPFLNGVLDAIQAPAQIIHGYENTFYFGQGPGTTNVVNDGRKEGYPGDRNRYELARSQIHTWRALSGNPAKYDKFVKVGMAAWVEDDPWNIWAGSGTKWSLWSNLQLALAYADEYVWVWSEHTKYGAPENIEVNPYLASLSNQTFNQGKECVFSFAENFTSDPLRQGWYFDFDMLAIGRKNPAHEVALMSPDAVPYGWKREKRTLNVSGTWTLGEQGEKLAPATSQRRRYVRPVKPLKCMEKYALTFDFQIDTFGRGAINPITIGVFESDTPLKRNSLTLQIRSATDLRIRFANPSAYVETKLALSNGLKPNVTYRFQLTSQGNGRFHAEIRVGSELVTLAKLKLMPIKAVGGFGWNEVGVALWEDAKQATPKEDAYHYQISRVVLKR